MTAAHRAWLYETHGRLVHLLWHACKRGPRAGRIDDPSMYSAPGYRRLARRLRYVRDRLDRAERPAYGYRLGRRCVERGPRRPRRAHRVRVVRCARRT